MMVVWFSCGGGADLKIHSSRFASLVILYLDQSQGRC